MCRYKDLFYIPRNGLNVRETSLAGDLVHYFIAVEAIFPGHLFEVRVYLQQLVVVHDVANKAEGKQRFDSAGAVGDDTQCSGGGDGGCSRVAVAALLASFKNTFIEVSENVALFGQI